MLSLMPRTLHTAHTATCNWTSTPRLPWHRSKGEVLPWAVIEEKLRSTQPYEVFM